MSSLARRSSIFSVHLHPLSFFSLQQVGTAACWAGSLLRGTALFLGDVLQRYEHQLIRRVKFQPSKCLWKRGGETLTCCCFASSHKSQVLAHVQAAEGNRAGRAERGDTTNTHQLPTEVIGFGSYPGKKGTISTAKHSGKSLAGKCRFIFSNRQWGMEKAQSCR